MRKPLVIGNWKMNGSNASVRGLVSELLVRVDSITPAEVAVCPSLIHTPLVSELLAGSSIALGVQNVCTETSGAYTGEVSVDMVKEYNCRFVLVGHSERREYYSETDDVVAQKFAVVQEAGMIPVLCVGETLSQREQGETLEVVTSQLNTVVQRCGVSALADAVIAYEPVWAIGTGKTATSDEAQAVHKAIREWIAKKELEISQQIRILYGGSVKPSNAKELFAMSDIDGGLIGGASLDAESFSGIFAAF